jgi:phosphopantothenoylcysteine synthetase/decarboxylase
MGTSRSRVLYQVVCAAPAASGVADFVRLAQAGGWRVRVIVTPMGIRFVDADHLAELTGDRVRVDFRMPDEADELPPADAVVVAPATFNTVNKWAAGITDTFASGLLCELTGVGVPIVAVPLVKDALAKHVAFARSLDVLRGMGVRVLFDPDAPPLSRMPDWHRVLEELHAVTGDRPDRRV